jgi:hypothetical protein
MKKQIIDEWHFLPELPEECEEVLIAIKYEKIPIQAYLMGGKWKMSFELKSWLQDKESVNPLLECEEFVYAWKKLPSVPDVPDPF